jgi:transglutaminase-like putative cysteine protease
LKIAMSARKTTGLWISTIVFTTIFLVLFALRLDLPNLWSDRPRSLSAAASGARTQRDSWMNIFRKDRKIGYSHTRFFEHNGRLQLEETVFMRVNTMGLVQDIHLQTRGRLNSDLTLDDFDFEINSGRFRFTVRGAVSGAALSIETTNGQDRRRFNVPFEAKPYLLAGVVDAVASTRMQPGDRFTFEIFDPATLAQETAEVEVVGPEAVEVANREQAATKIALDFRGVRQMAWISPNGDILREKGLLGIQLEKTTRQDALQGLALQPSDDLTQTASVASNLVLAHPDRLASLSVELSGISPDSLNLQGGRQIFEPPRLTVVKEDLSQLPSTLEQIRLSNLEKAFLQPSPFIESDHAKIKELAAEIVGPGRDRSPLQTARKLLDWVYRHLEKRPVISLPDALSTLENRVGDCNEHAVLFAALSRAAGIPCRVEAGLVYLKGRFYYHAWNLVYIGRWVTVDSVFDQLPADVSHIRLVSGAPHQQLDLMRTIGSLQLKIVAAEPIL